MIQRPLVNYPSQFAILIGLMGVCIIVGGLAVSFIGSQLLHVPFLQVGVLLSKPEHANLSRLLNTLASLLAFFLPALFLARILNKKPFYQLGFNSSLNLKQLLLVILITFASMVLSGALGDLNEHIPLPASWLAKAKALEETYKSAMLGMATMKTPADFLLSLLVLAAAPALFEEVLFRGGFQQIFIGWTKSKWAGIIITSIFFSAIHFSYFGFLPRLALGIVLGLIFYYSKNIWLNIFLHFLNNAFVVTQLYVLSRQAKSVAKTMDESMPVWWGLVAILLLLIFLKPFIAECRRVLQKNVVEGEEASNQINIDHG
jgi:membrane protease YdiL (CAAX protease family)